MTAIPIEPGARIGGRYVVSGEVGAGGMGVVVRAMDTRLGRDVALKVLSAQAVGDATARARLLREARSAAALEHVGIVHVYDVGETDDGGAYLVMELVRGESLRALIELGDLPPARLLTAMVEVARALAFAHQRGVVHRDVKPDNVMLREDGRAVVLDFGIAKGSVGDEPGGSSPTLTLEGQLVGTPAYLSPEQARGEEMDGRSDQFALTDLPLPESRSLEALAVYRAAVQATRDGAAATAVTSLRRAVELDPTMAAAWWRLADFLVATGDLDRSREAYAKAMQLRSLLTERDLAFLLAEEPVIQWTVPDVAEARRRYEALTLKYPLDAEIHGSVAYFAYEASDYPAARAAASKSLELDPQYGMAWMLRGWVFQAEDDEVGARRAFATCQELSSGATNCIMNLAHIQGAHGECDAMKAAAQRLAAVAPGEHYGAMYSAFALAAGGAPVESLRDPVDQWATKGATSPAERPQALAQLDLWVGDFRMAKVRADEMEALLTASAGRSVRGVAARLRADALVEEGRTEEAAKVADRFLKRRGSWVQGVFDNAPLRDATPALLAIARRGGALKPDEWAAHRDEWVSQWKQSAPSAQDAKDIWLALALAADSRKDAEESLAKVPANLPQLRWDSERDRAMGKLHFLAGRIDEAIPWLKRASASCIGLMAPVDHVRSTHLLGQALEQRGDKDGACKAYRFVEERWGHATPRSVTAAEAKARATKLQCPK